MLLHCRFESNWTLGVFWRFGSHHMNQNGNMLFFFSFCCFFFLLLLYLNTQPLWASIVLAFGVTSCRETPKRLCAFCVRASLDIAVTRKWVNLCENGWTIPLGWGFIEWRRWDVALPREYTVESMTCAYGWLILSSEATRLASEATRAGYAKMWEFVSHGLAYHKPFYTMHPGGELVR